jgi:hypothetical protein
MTNESNEDKTSDAAGGQIEPVVICKLPVGVLAEIVGYLTAAADGSMSRNNSEALADELLELIARSRI